MATLRKLIESTPSIEQLSMAILFLDEQSECRGTCELDAGQFVSPECNCSSVLIKPVAQWLKLVKSELTGK